MRSPTVPSEVRALTMLDVVPAGCRAMSVLNDHHAPHLRRGEVVIIDPTDCSLVHGELFIVTYSNGPAIMQVVWRTTGNLSAWWCVSLDDPTSWADCQARMKAGRVLRMADGPYRAGGLEERTLGRVVGILQSEPAQVSMGADRRAVLAGLPFAAVPAVAIPSRLLAGSADPFATYHQRILAIHAAVEAAPNDEVAERMMDAWGDVDHEALAGCPTTLAGAAGALEYARREFVQFQVHDDEATADPSKRLILHLLDGALDVLRQAAMGGQA